MAIEPPSPLSFVLARFVASSPGPRHNQTSSSCSSSTRSTEPTWPKYSASCTSCWSTETKEWSCSTHPKTTLHPPQEPLHLRHHEHRRPIHCTGGLRHAAPLRLHPPGPNHRANPLHAHPLDHPPSVLSPARHSRTFAALRHSAQRPQPCLRAATLVVGRRRSRARAQPTRTRCLAAPNLSP